ncbi:glycosyltransferase [Edwardsiella piscicida]|uniref:glycosyltransferase family 2 protein n=1 Tax=Edwardsiella piscicida TaxID=1263550 RepID=UPI00370D5BD1
MTERPFITVSIKTFNEAQGIAATIDSVRRQLADYPHQIIVADGLSTDSTVALALAQGARVVTLTHPADRCCGVGHQMGYLFSQGEYLLLLDGDMILAPGFIDAAVDFLSHHPDYAGVAGQVEMDDAANHDFRSRRQRLARIYPLGDCDHLGGGGLYRRSAIAQIGYLTNRNLHGLEEAELGMRLGAAGYRLRRLAIPYFRHRSHALPTAAMLKYRWRSGFLWGPGELLRSAWGKPYVGAALRCVRNELLFTLYLLALLLTLPTLWFSPWPLLLMLLPLAAFTLRKSLQSRSLADGALSVVTLTLFAAGLLRGLLRPQRDPRQPPACRERVAEGRL